MHVITESGTLGMCAPAIFAGQLHYSSPHLRIFTWFPFNTRPFAFSSHLIEDLTNTMGSARSARLKRGRPDHGMPEAAAWNLERGRRLAAEVQSQSQTAPEILNFYISTH